MMTEEAKKQWLEFQGVLKTQAGTYYKATPANRAYKTPEIVVDQAKNAIEHEMTQHLKKDNYTDFDKEYIRGMKRAIEILSDIRPPKQ